MRRGLPLVLCMVLAFGASAANGAASSDIAPAERLVFIDNHLAGLKPPTVLRYGLETTGPGDQNKPEQLWLTAQPREGGGCCAVTAEERGGETFAYLQPVGDATSNPVILYFLERDLKQMQAKTGGSPNYFRRLIRLALADGATVKDVKVRYAGREVTGQEVVVTPFTNDGRIARFGTLTGKTYDFIIAKDVPGGVLQLKTRVEGDAGAAPTEATLTLLEPSAASAAQ